MKRKKLFTFFTLLCALCVNIYSQNGFIKVMSGEVTLKVSGSGDFIPAEIGSEVLPGTIVSTGFRSTAVIGIGSTTLTVRPLTRLSLADIQASYEEEKLNINLRTGRIRVEVNPSAGIRTNTQVQSPMTVASVRGTGFDMDTQNLRVFDGRVFFRSIDGKAVPVTKGFSSSVKSSRLGSGSGVDDPFESAVRELLPALPVGTDYTGKTSVAPFIPITTTSAGFEVEWSAE